eukprot:COSAG05_NODE_1613_length_4406_cov_23.155561_2_plen_52_part_00
MSETARIQRLVTLVGLVSQAVVEAHRSKPFQIWQGTMRDLSALQPIYIDLL